MFSILEFFKKFSSISLSGKSSPVRVKNDMVVHRRGSRRQRVTRVIVILPFAISKSFSPVQVRRAPPLRNRPISSKVQIRNVLQAQMTYFFNDKLPHLIFTVTTVITTSFEVLHFRMVKRNKRKSKLAILDGEPVSKVFKFVQENEWAIFRLQKNQRKSKKKSTRRRRHLQRILSLKWLKTSRKVKSNRKSIMSLTMTRLKFRALKMLK